MTKFITGAGGKKKKSKTRIPVEAANTLSSNAVARVVEVLSEGEIEGLVNGAKSIYFDGTPLQNTDNTYNFRLVEWDTEYGTPNQTPMPGFPSTETEVSVNVEVNYGVPVQRETLVDGIDAVRITILLPQGLWYQNKENGDLLGYSVTVAFETRPIGGVWTRVKTRTISGKAMEPYEESHRIETPVTGGSKWQFRVVRLSGNDPNSAYSSKTTWSRYTAINDIKLPYNNTAYIGLKIDAQSTGGEVPTRSYLIDGIKCKVPTNYNAFSHTYTGDWNGQFKTSWTDNPAWIVYDLLTSDRYGLGLFIEDSMVNKWSFYDAGRYNDQLVSNGDGGQEPRFTFNAVINTRQEAWKLIQAVASSCRSVVYYGGGQIQLIQDRPEPVSLIVNKSDVIDGMFEYASTSLQQRHPVIQVTYNNKDDRYNPATITVEDTDGISRYGYNVKDIVAYGATTQGQARRLGLWTLYTDINTTDTVKFKCGLNLATRIQPGAVIKIVDEEMMGVPFGGRTVSGTKNSITLDREVDLVSGQTYTVDWVDVDGITIISRQVANTPGEYTTLTWVDPAVTFQGTGDTVTYANHGYVTGYPLKFKTIVTTTGITTNTTYYVKNPQTNTFQLSATPGGDVINLTNNGTGTLDTTAPQTGRSWVMTSTDIEGSLYRIYAVSEQGGTEFEVTALAYTPQKYTEIDQITNPDEWIPITKVFNYCPSPTDIAWKRETGTDSYGRRVVNLRINWSIVDEQYVSVYYVSYRRDGKEVTNNVVTSYKEFVIPNVSAGTYEVFVTAVNISDVKSPVSISSFYNDLSGGISSLPAPLNLQVKGGGTVWNGKDLVFTWQQDTANPNYNTGESVFKEYYIELVDVGTNTVIRSDSTTNTEYTYYFDDNLTDAGTTPRRNVKVRLFNKDSLNRTSTSITATFTNPVPSAPTYTLVGGYQYYTVIVEPVAGATDIAGYYVAEVTVPGATPTAGDIVYKGPNPRIDIGYYDPEVIVRVGTYDMYGDAIGDVVWATAQTTTVTQAQEVIDSAEGYKFFTLLFKPNDPAPNSVSWTASAVVKTSTGETKSCPAGNAAWTGTALYLYYDWTANEILTTTNILYAVGVGKAILATYYGGKTLNSANGDAYIDGNKILAQTVGASQIVAGSITANEIAANTITGNKLVVDQAVITNGLQITNGLINGVHIQDGAITATEIAANTITSGNLRTDVAVITTQAQIQDALISTAKIGDLQVTTLKIGDHAVSDFVAYENTTVSYLPKNDSNVLTTIAQQTFTSANSPQTLVDLTVEYQTEGDGLDKVIGTMPTQDFEVDAHLVFKVSFQYYNGSTWVEMPWYTQEDVVVGTTKMNLYQVATVNSGTRWMSGPLQGRGGAAGDYYGPIRDWLNQPSVYGLRRKVNRSFVIPTGNYTATNFRVTIQGWHYVRWYGLDTSTYITPAFTGSDQTQILSTIVSIIGMKK